MLHALQSNRLRCLGRCLMVPGVVALASSLVGCNAHTLETGYEYRPLNSTLVERQAFYADPYSLAARRAEQEQDEDRNPAIGRFGR